eukprot:16433123-Heterocapsa_arctica.AAC.1
MHRRHAIKKIKGHRGNNQVHLKPCTEQSISDFQQLVDFMKDNQGKRKVEIHYTLMEQKKINIGVNQCGYIMFEDPKNKEYAGKLKERAKSAERDGKSLSIKGDIVKKNMAMGFNWHLNIKTGNGRHSETENGNDKLSGR